MQGRNSSGDGKDGSVHFFNNRCRATTKEIEIAEGQPLRTRGENKSIKEGNKQQTQKLNIVTKLLGY